MEPNHNLLQNIYSVSWKGVQSKQNKIFRNYSENYPVTSLHYLRRLILGESLHNSDEVPCLQIQIMLA